MKKSTALNRQDRIEYLKLQEALAVKKARRDFWSFCRLLYPEFYKESRSYLKDLCITLQSFYDGDINKQILIINMPPDMERHLRQGCLCFGYLDKTTGQR